jgi:hypothetical protein
MNNLKMLEMALNQLKDTGDEWVNDNKGKRYKIDDVLAKISRSSVETYSEQMQNELEPITEPSDVKAKLSGDYIIEGGIITHIDGVAVDWTFHTTDDDCEFEEA